MLCPVFNFFNKIPAILSLPYQYRTTRIQYRGWPFEYLTCRVFRYLPFDDRVSAAHNVEFFFTGFKKLTTSSPPCKLPPRDVLSKMCFLSKDINVRTIPFPAMMSLLVFSIGWRQGEQHHLGRMQENCRRFSGCFVGLWIHQLPVSADAGIKK